MKDLNELRNKIKFELNEKIEAKESDNNNESENETETGLEGKKQKGGVLGIRQSNSQLIAGRVSKDFNWEIDYDVLRKAICDDVITVDIQKTKKIFKLVKDYISNPEKFEQKYNKK